MLIVCSPGRSLRNSPVRVTVSPSLIVALLENSEEKRPHHRVLMEVPPGPILAFFDVNRMKQVFWNLANNALKAMPEGGTLTVRVAPEKDGQTILTFMDSGIGMPGGDVAANFQPFHGSFQGGSGLGLAIVYRIIEEHGGRIRVNSRTGAGTQFAIHLPCRIKNEHTGERQWTAS